MQVTHEMSPWFRWVFIDILPRILSMQRPDIFVPVNLVDLESPDRSMKPRRERHWSVLDGSVISDDLQSKVSLLSRALLVRRNAISAPPLNQADNNEQGTDKNEEDKMVTRTVQSICFIAHHLMLEDKKRNVSLHHYHSSYHFNS